MISTWWPLRWGRATVLSIAGCTALTLLGLWQVAVGSLLVAAVLLAVDLVALGAIKVFCFPRWEAEIKKMYHDLP